MNVRHRNAVDVNSIHLEHHGWPNGCAQYQHVCTIQNRLSSYLRHRLQSFFHFKRTKRKNDYVMKKSKLQIADCNELIDVPFLIASSSTKTLPDRFTNSILWPSFESIATPAES